MNKVPDMKKCILLVIFVSLCNVITLFGQADTLSLDSCGIDDDMLLNKYESRFLNILYQDYRNDFDFTNKRVVFGDYWDTGVNYHREVKKQAKNTIFNEYVAHKFNKSGKVPYLGNIIILSGDDYTITNAFDAIIITKQKKRAFGRKPFISPTSKEVYKEQIISKYANYCRDITLFGQADTVNLNFCEIDNDILLSEYESRFLNILYQNYRADFDFTNKRVIIGDYWGYLDLYNRKVKIRPKNTIFRKHVVNRFNTYRKPPYLGNIIVLSGDDYEITTAFDVLIITGESKLNMCGDKFIHQPPYKEEYTKEVKKIIISNYAKLFEE